VDSVGCGGFLTLLDIKKDMVKLLSQAGPGPGIKRITTGAVIAIFSSKIKRVMSILDA
jgi:hypothetical protein